MFRVLVLGKTEEIAKEIASWAVSGETLENTYGKKYEIGDRSAVIRTFPIWAGQKGAAAIGDVVLVVAKTPEDLAALKPVLTPYKKIPLKFVLYDGAANQPDFETEFKVLPLLKGSPMEFVERLISANNDLVKLIASVFKSFDKNNDNFIELEELQAMSKELGAELSPEEAKKAIKIMDINKDGKISLEEFISWWKTGFRGSSQRIFSLVKKVTKDNFFLQKAMAGLQFIKPAPETDKVISTKFGIYVKKFEEAGLKFDATLLSNGKELDEEFKTFGAPFGFKKNEIFAAIGFGTANPEESAKKLEEIMNAGILLGSSLSAKAKEGFTDVDFKYGASGKYAIACAVPSVKGSSDLAPFMPFLEKLSGVMLPNQSISLRFCTAFDFEKLANEERSILDVSLDGVSFEILGQFNPYLKERITEIAKAINIVQAMPAAVQNVATQALGGTMLSSLNGDIEFDPTPELIEMIRTASNAEDPKLTSTPCKTLKEEMKQGIEQGAETLPLFNDIYSFIKDGVDNITFMVYLCNLGGIRVVLDLKGLPKFLN